MLAVLSQTLFLPNFLVFCSFWVAITEAKPRVIELDHQPSGRTGDIKQLWAAHKVDKDEREDEILRNALKPNAQNKWDKNKGSKGHYIIPYVMTGKFDSAQKKIIKKAMKKIARNSCVKFQKRSSVKGKHRKDYVDIQNMRGEGCYTTVGRFSGRNVLMLETNQLATCLVPTTVIHELLHVVGLWHEQMRYDRDKYIKIHYENIVRGTASQFEKVPQFASSTYNVKYDYKSVMHYKKDAFSRGGITMETKKKSFQNVIGSAADASKGDYVKICSIYNCPKCMGKAFKKNSGKKKKKRRTEATVVFRDTPVKEVQPLDVPTGIDFNESDPNSSDESEKRSESMPLEASNSNSASIESIEGGSEEGEECEQSGGDVTKTFELSAFTEI